MPEFRVGMSNREVFEPTMEITTQEEADRFFNALVEFTMAEWEKSRHQCEISVRSDLRLYASRYNVKIQNRVERLFGFIQPMFEGFSKGSTTQ